MVRPCIRRRVRGRPNSCYFKPAGIRAKELVETLLTLPEFEAIRLVDFEGVEQGKAGEMMKISQPTLSRILKSARKIKLKLKQSKTKIHIEYPARH